MRLVGYEALLVYLANEIEGLNCELPIVSIDGLSNSGKSTLSDRLAFVLSQMGLHALNIEGDLFHRGKIKGMTVYNELIEQISNSYTLPDDFVPRVWNFKKLENDLLVPIQTFRSSDDESLEVVLHDVLDKKADGSEHNETYELTGDSVILMPGMYISRSELINYRIFLDASVDVLIHRKIERSEKVGFKRDPKVTRDMVELIESPTMINHYENYLKGRKGVIIHTDDFKIFEVSDL